MVIGALHAVLSGNHDGGEARLGLLYAASLGGIAISNIRTGNIHEAGGALLECSELTHPETLFVFLRAAIDQYATAVPDREVRLLAELAIRVPEVRLSSLDDVVAWWEGVFALNGLTESVAGKLARVSLPSADLEKYVVERVVADRVWAEKESPVPLSNADIEHMVKQSLRRFRHSAEGR
jgi:alcohol dehydrogenase class IV